ncbi:TIR-like protein FxsC [Streptomyces sp. NPDC098077]|uniref:TIR-like protein FxsC n=1 Tax=Streptomyces sp. NPDC098077 TaxID=3366093 RepID=UPI003826C637
MHERAEGLRAVVAALCGLDRDFDAERIAEILWLAARDDGSAAGGGAGSDGTGRREDPGTPATADGPPADSLAAEVDQPVRRSSLHTPWRDGAPGSGAVGVSLPRAGSLPRGRELARALKPLKRPWPRGRRQRLDITATVSDYVRVGELTPVFSDEPERWFDATVVVDRSPTMAVWAGTADDLVRLLARTGVFRTVRVHELYADPSPENTPTLHGPLGQRVEVGGGRSVQPRRLMFVFSDWASAAWRDGSQWNRLRTWADSVPTVLLNPLPSKIWRQTGMSLPAVRVVSPGTPGATNAQLRFVRTLLMEHAFPGTADRDWLPVPVNSLSPHAVGRWARTLMLADPAGCEALLLPAPGRVEQMAEEEEGEGVADPLSGRSLTDAYLYRASPAAVRLAVLCSLYPQVSVDLLRVVQQSLVPEATTADLAEFVVGGLVTVTEAARAGGHAVLRFRDGTREQLMPRLGTRDARRLNSAVDRFIASNSGSLKRFSAAVSGEGTATGIPVDPEPFGEVSAGALPAVGLPADAALPAGPVETSGTPSAELLEEPAADPAAVTTAEEPEDLTRATDAGPTGRETFLRPFARGPAGRETARPADHRPYFFLSYAHTPGYAGGADPDMWVERLFQDLCGHVMAMTDLPAGAPAAFVDREIRSGEGWSERLGEALATCRVFVPLFSPRYFASETCGKEWYVFEQRAIHHRARSNQPADAIVPALWAPVPPSQLPGVAERLQFNHRDFGERYVSEGLLGLIRLRIFAQEYERAVYELAKRIVSVADSVRIDTARPVDYRQAPSAFGSPGSRGGGLRPMRITVVAPTRHDLPEGRSPEHYGDTPEEWRPYSPDASRPLAKVTEELVRSLNYQAFITSFDEDRHDGTAPPSAPEILLVDRWALRDEDRRRRLAAFDAENRPWVAVVVPWNRRDPQSGAAEVELTELLEATLPGAMRRAPVSVRAAARGLPSVEAFGQALPLVVEVAAHQFLRHAQVNPPTQERRDRTFLLPDRDTP